NFQATVSHKVILSGESKQVISFEDAAVNSSHFNYLEITNTSNEGVTFESVAYVTNGLASTVSQINNSHNIHIANRFSIDEGNWPFDLTIAGSVSLEKNQEIVGNLYLDNSLNLNGFNLTVNGNVEQHAGILQMAGGYLTIGGDYRMQIPDDSTDSGYTFSNGFLKMTNPNDYMLVHGDFYMDSRYGGFDSHSSSSYYIYNGDWLIAGTLELKGDFTQLSTSTTDVVSYLERYYPHENFQSTGEHQVILYGSAEFEDPESSFFNDPDG
ncbi:hypothetical protein Q4575_17025, partial [Psychrosphaera sp. 1_MG-2023]|uniref:hypothetical protein n=1 Tax=Psychrosphaera sp. 1_MG-2023 TaxID=3062643 RepID=UPI0026E41C9F